MGKQTKPKPKSKSKKDEKGSGFVTATQVAFIVDRYLSDNNFLVTLSAFRSEASSLLPSSPTHIANQSAKGLLKLGDMLDGYIRLKAEKILLDEEKTRLEHEKSRVHNLLRGMQHVMNAYNGAAPPPPLPPSSSNPTPPPPPPACFPVPVYNTSRVGGGPPSNSISQQQQQQTCYSTPPTTSSSSSSLKRRIGSKHASAPSLLPSINNNNKRSRTKSSSAFTTTTIPHPHPPMPSTTTTTNHITSTSPPPLPGSSSVVKCLFNSGPQTPSPPPTDKSVDNQTPPSTNNNNKKILPPPIQPQQQQYTNRTVITSETIQVSPMKQVSYYSIERNHSISSPIKTTPPKRNHVKGRLDFDDASEILPSNSGPSPSQDDGFDFDLPNLDCFGGDFSFGDLLGDFDLDGFCPMQNVGSSPESQDKMVDGDRELLSGMSSTFTEIQSDQDVNNISGPNSVTSVKSVTKCIKVFSPVKRRRSVESSDQEIVDADVVA